MTEFLDFTDAWGEGGEHQEETVYEMHEVWHSKGGVPGKKQRKP